MTQILILEDPASQAILVPLLRAKGHMITMADTGIGGWACAAVRSPNPSARK
ncbi:MAG: hypothetical protein M3R61_08040 [Chloroflexota bacterium]|nr:hypothetical protein [Chloroflexota bacterium]